MSCKCFHTMKHTPQRASPTKTDGLYRKNLQKVVKNRKIRDFCYSDGFGDEPIGFSHFNRTIRLLKHSLDVLQAFSDHETHCIPDAGN